MSVISGGIFSKPRGKTGGIVFGAARTRTGKLATARELVSPSNPNTALQQTQRSKFKSVLDLVRRIGAAIYQVAWNRSIGQLPGFQSMMSIFLGQISATKQLILVTAINLGTVESTSAFNTTDEGGGSVLCDWNTAVTSNGLPTDQMIMIAIAEEDADRALPGGVVLRTDLTRADGEGGLSGLVPSRNYQMYYYFVGADANSGNFSIANFHSFVMDV